MGLRAVTRGGWVAIGASALAVSAGGAFAGEQYANKPVVSSIEPPPDTAVATRQPLIAVATTNVRSMNDLSVTVDGDDRTADVAKTADGRLVLKAGALKDGEHEVRVAFGTGNVFARKVERSWSFIVDTTVPKIAVTSPKAGATVNKKSLPFAGTSEPNTRVTVGWKGGSAEGVADESGTWEITAAVPEGGQRVKITAKDPAGNASITTHRVIVDTTAPGLRLAKLPATLTETDTPTFTGGVTGETAARSVVGAVVNGREVTAQPGIGGFDDSGNPLPGVAFTGSEFQLSVGRLPQGRNTVKVFVRDRAGNRSEKTLRLLVDSTEELGGHDLIKGARGADVKLLQQELKTRGFKRTKVTGVYDDQTVRGIRNYQRVRKLSQSGVFGPRTRQVFAGRIVVDLSSFKLTLIRDGKVVKRYPIAHGTARYPTPIGTFRIVNKQANPTWTPPPDSDWAKGLGPIPPGPGNPLGTRWMGTSAQYVGIHGTPAAGSIGTRASHGCIRMRIPDAEALYEDVIVGMPVQIQT